VAGKRCAFSQNLKMCASSWIELRYVINQFELEMS